MGAGLNRRLTCDPVCSEVPVRLALVPNVCWWKNAISEGDRVTIGAEGAQPSDRPGGGLPILYRIELVELSRALEAATHGSRIRFCLDLIFRVYRLGTSSTILPFFR